MARLPQPGGDNGNWGTILNEYLTQALNTNGTLKDNVVTSNAIAPNAITSANIATNAITATQIADGSITEPLLTSSVQTKLNQAAPTWTTLTGKPTIIAAGTDTGVARALIGALNSTEVQNTIALWAGADAYIDFTTKPNGDPPSVLDTGQSVDYTWGPSNWKTQISDGKLIPGTLPGSGNYADYYQAQLDGDCLSFGTRWTVDSSDGSTTDGAVCIAVWASTYQTSGTEPPKTPAHITFSTTTGTWAWFVGDGGGTSGASHLKAVKNGTFTAPASDGVAIWECAAYVDPDNGIAYLYLPGNDTATGTRWVTVTDADLATYLAAQSVPVTTLAATSAGANVLMVEHYANPGANTARYPRYLEMWGNVRRKPRNRQFDLDLKVRSTAPITYKRYFPSGGVPTSITPTTSLADVDGTNAIISATAGPTGKILFEADVYYEFTGADTVFMRFTSGTLGSTTAEAVKVGVTGEKARIHIVAEKTGLTPGSTGTFRLGHSCLNSAVAMKIGGNLGASQVPGLYIKATPL